jgi:hypothetical protein
MSLKEQGGETLHPRLSPKKFAAMKSGSCLSAELVIGPQIAMAAKASLISMR